MRGGTTKAHASCSAPAAVPTAALAAGTAPPPPVPEWQPSSPPCGPAIFATRSVFTALTAMGALSWMGLLPMTRTQTTARLIDSDFR